MSLGVRVELSGGGGLRRWSWTRVAEQWADEVGPLLLEGLKEKAPVARGVPGSGRLRQSIVWRRQSRVGTVRLEFSTDVPYARYVLSGTGEYQIPKGGPRKGTVLHWVDAAGNDRFARSVKHPVVPPNRFNERAVEELLPVIRERFRQVVIEALRS